MKPFDRAETGYTPTAMTLAPTIGQEIRIDFEIWGTPEREKINAALVAANQYQYRRRGCM